MFISLNLAVPREFHTVTYHGDKYPIGGQGVVIVRITDIRSAFRRVGATLIEQLNGQKYAVQESPERIMELIQGARPQEWVAQDRAVMGSVHVSGRVESSVQVCGEVRHLAPPPAEVEA